MRRLTTFLLLVWILAVGGVVEAAESFGQAAIYYNEACGGCNVYLEEKLIPYLEEQGIKVVKYDYVNDKSKRRELVAKQKELAIPYYLQSHIMTFLDGGKVVIAGHVPLARVAELLAAPKLPTPLLLYQDKMLEMGVNPEDVTYTVWQPGFEPQEYALREPLGTYLRSWQEGKLTVKNQENPAPLWWLVLTTGLLDGINPCAIAVLLFFIAFLLSLRSSWRRIWGLGLVYIAVIYLTYLGIGLGLLKAIVISQQPHLMAKIGAWLVIMVGLVNIISYYSPRFPLRLQMPSFGQTALKKWLTKATWPAVIIGAFLVGLCTFPCSGGIYVAVVGLLAAERTFWQGFLYLLFYNLMFVIPLLVLLLLASNRYVLGQVAEWHQRSGERLKLWLGGAMIVLGGIILWWFV